MEDEEADVIFEETPFFCGNIYINVRAATFPWLVKRTIDDFGKSVINRALLTLCISYLFVLFNTCTTT